MPYHWRRLSEIQREEILSYRKRLRRPWHRPPHFQQGNIYYHLTSACFDHQPWIGESPERMACFCEDLLSTLPAPPAAWCVLPNHYHLLVKTPELATLVRTLGQFHGRCSFLWNKEDDTRGRQVWHATSDRSIRNEGHFWATMNYIHHNAVKHAYVTRWEDWPFSSAEDFLEEMGREAAKKLWKAYPVLNYGDGWDD